MTVELIDPCLDPEPADWVAFCRAEDLTAIWGYDFLRAAAANTWAPPVLGLMRNGGRVVGIIGAVYIGLRRPGSNRPPRRRREPILLDVRLAGHAFGPTWHFTADVSLDRRHALLGEFERAVTDWLGWGLAGITYRQLTDRAMAAVRRPRAFSIGGLSSNEMLLNWDSTDEWLDSLPGGFGGQLRANGKTLDDTYEIKFGSLRADLDIGELGRLNRHHQDLTADRRDPRPPIPNGVFTALASRDDVSILTYEDKVGRLIGFGVFLDHSARPRLGWWGSRITDQSERRHLLLDSYTRMTSKAISGGAEAVTAGKGLAADKRLLGFQEVPLKMLVAPRWATL